MAARVFWPPACGLHLISRLAVPRVVRAFGLFAAHTLRGCGETRWSYVCLSRVARRSRMRENGSRARWRGMDGSERSQNVRSAVVLLGAL